MKESTLGLNNDIGIKIALFENFVNKKKKKEKNRQKRSTNY